MFLVLLAIVWAGVGVYWFRTRTPATPSMSIGNYSKRLSVLGGSDRSSGLAGIGGADVVQLRGAPVGPMGAPRSAQVRTGRGITSAQARIRRRNVLVALASASVLSLLAVFAFGGTTLILTHLVIDALLLGFVLALVQYQREVEYQRTLQRPVYAAAQRPTSLAATGTDDAVGIDVLSR
ncbi:MAG: hypothetical protein ACE367_17585 [Acidimicrobiales bacterium]